MLIASVVQASPVFLNLAASVEKAVRLIGDAAGQGARIVAFPETWLPGYPVWLDYAPGAGLWNHPPASVVFRRLWENSVALDSPEIGTLVDAAAKARCLVAMGVHERVGSTLYNSILYLGEGGVLGVHRKLMPTYTERMIWGQGDGSTLTVIDFESARVGGLICWEHWMPLTRAAMHDRQELVHIAQWPMVNGMNLVASRHYAFEGQCFVLAAGATLHTDDLPAGFPLLDEIPRGAILKGGSAIIGPDGGMLAGPVRDDEATLPGRCGCSWGKR
ncbi:MAG: carbon-nitrogen hydrolase family protein, partial [Bryobacteraceae bacterium]